LLQVIEVFKHLSWEIEVFLTETLIKGLRQSATMTMLITANKITIYFFKVSLLARASIGKSEPKYLTGDLHPLLFIKSLQIVSSFQSWQNFFYLRRVSPKTQHLF